MASKATTGTTKTSSAADIRTGPRSFLPGHNDWLAALRAAGRSSITVECYGRDLDEIAVAAGGDCASDRRISEFDQSTMDALTAIWEAAGASRSTVLRRFASLRGLASFLCAQGANCGRVLASKMPPPVRGVRVTLDDRDLAALTTQSPEMSQSQIAIRDHSIVILKADVGLTTGELSALDVADVDLERQTIRVVRTHLKPRVLRIALETSSAIRDYLDNVRGTASGALFLSLRRTRLCARSIQVAFRRLRRQRGVREEATLRSLRHTLGAGFASNGAPISLVAESLGLAVGSAARYFGSEGRQS